MTSRREFIAGCVSVAFVGGAGGRDHVRPCPGAYYESYLEAMAARIRANAVTCDVGFWFLTDPHVKTNHRQSGVVCADLIGRTGIRRVLCGGDLVEAFGKGYPTDRDAVDFAIGTFREQWVKPLRAADGMLYCAKGNHDFTVRHSMDTADGLRGFTYSGAEARRHIVESWTETDVTTNANDPSGCYYFFDDASAKIRFIVADTTDSERAGDVAWGVAYGVHDTQLAWLAETAFGTLPVGYDVVVMHHIPVVGVVGSEGDVQNFANLRDLLEGYQKRAVVRIGGRVFDFSRAQGRILLDLTGHMHAERQTFQSGILHVTEPCDAAYFDYILGSAPWCGNLPEKKGGTVYEQTFDAVQIAKSRKYVRFTRVGGGQDRVIHLEPRVVRVGETLRFEPSFFGGDTTFACYNGDRIGFRPNPGNRWNPFVVYGTDFAEISATGVLKARKPGLVMALAMDAHLNKEIFPVTVVA